MKRILLATSLLLCSLGTQAVELDSACLVKVKERVAETIALFGDVDQSSIQVALIRSAPAKIQMFDEEPGEAGLRVFTKANLKTKQGESLVFLNESGVIGSSPTEKACQVLYTKPDVAL